MALLNGSGHPAQSARFAHSISPAWMRNLRRRIQTEETEPQDIPPEKTITTEAKSQDATPEESTIVESEVVCEQVTTAQKRDTPKEIVHAKTSGANDIPVIIEHAKTGYGDEEPEILPQPAPEPEPLADIQVAIDTACA